MARTKGVKGSQGSKSTEILFVAGFGPISQDPKRSWALYGEALGIPFEREPGDYAHTNELDGVKHFAIWPLAQAAESCFGTPVWPADLPVPQAWIEFDAADLRSATEELEQRGYRLLVRARTEPWGQTVTRLLGPEGLLVGVTETPWLRSKKPGGSH